jgi:hypothetical protein
LLADIDWALQLTYGTKQIIANRIIVWTAL